MSIFIGIVMVVVFACPVQERYYRRRVAECGGGTPPPEARLPLMMFGSIVLPIALFIFASTSPQSVHWAGALVSGIPFGFALGAYLFCHAPFVLDYQRLTMRLRNTQSPSTSAQTPTSLSRSRSTPRVVSFSSFDRFAARYQR
mgnify:FL=1|jgi:hypothetical protein